MLLLAALLYGATAFAKSTIEARVTESLEDDLREAGYDHIDVEVDGQEVTLRGPASATVTEGELRRLGRASAGATWAGALPVARSVRVELLEPAAPEPEPEPEPEPAPASWADLRARLEGGELTLEGEATSLSAKALLQRLAMAATPEDESAGVVTRVRSVNAEALTARDHLTPSMEGSGNLAERAVRAIRTCESGEAKVAGGVFELRCLVPEADLEALRLMATAPTQGGSVGGVTLVATEQAEACDRRFESALQGRTIEFAVNSAQITRAGERRVDAIARVAEQCPGAIRVEGHTDDTGDRATNLTLSRARADAVVNALEERGIPAERLHAVGFGPDRPREAGTSNTARARNRRIEFHVEAL
ncbi:MAG: OmpA family protein [Myxococcota bacterium]